MNYDVNYFIKKFEAIPEDLWLVGSLMNDKGQRCAQGHCGIQTNSFTSKIYIGNPEADSLIEMFGRLDITIREGQKPKKASEYGKKYNFNVTYVNDGDCDQYQQPTPKQRILAALYDIKKMQEPQHTDITKELAVLPVSETSDLITTNILQ